VSLDEFEDLIDAADGTRSDYALERAPLNDEGGQGQGASAAFDPAFGDAAHQLVIGRPLPTDGVGVRMPAEEGCVVGSDGHGSRSPMAHP
jgi:hypothetical protein